MKKNSPLSEENKTEIAIFRRINTKFKEYWRFLFWLMGIYIGSYLIWLIFLSPSALKFFKSNPENEWSISQWWMLLGVGILQGLLFALDGFVTAWLKAPFNQMCYAINDASEEEINYDKKDYIIKKATESNEHCKETLKKFGILTISQELIRVFLFREKAGDIKLGQYWYLINVSYLIPLAFAFLAIFSIHKKLKELKRSLSSHHALYKKNRQIKSLRNN